MAFTHLHVHTEFSLLDGSNKISEYVKCVKNLGQTAAAITDHGVMYGAIDFYKAAREEGIKPIIGCEVYVAPNSRFDKEIGGGEERYHHLVLLAENNTGYANLCKIVSIGFTEGYYYRPRVDFEILQQYHEGLIALSACLAGEVPRYIEKGFIEEAKKCAIKYRDCFGDGNYYLELQDHGISEQHTVNAQLLTMSRELNIPLVATNDVHYTYASDAGPHELLLCLQTGKTIHDENRLRYEGGQFYVKSEDEMRILFPYAVEAIENTQKIADRCNVEIEFGVTKLPHYEVPKEFVDKAHEYFATKTEEIKDTEDQYASWLYLNSLCDAGLKERYPDRVDELRTRLDYELGVIHKMGYVDYFLIVWDYINFSREHGIAVGPGRGSAAGSIVSYCLHITNIDPIRFNLLFERFLNPERVSMPDIDVDFCYERRQEVIDYVKEKYGQEKVVQIVTFGTLQAKGVIRDIARVLDLPYQRGDQIAKMIPQELGMTLDKALTVNPELKQLYDNDEEVRYLYDMSRRLEGLPRHTSMHAAGVLICPEAADNFVPLSRGADGSITTQYVMTTLEELGLLKMDFLGLRTLTVIQDAVKLIEKSRGIQIDIDNIDYNDSKVLASIGTGRCEGIFQLESAGMKSFMKELKPQSLEDMTAGISLYRPGPMDFIPQYIQGKDNRDSIKYLTPELEPILEPTYGCIVYQEQVMQIVRDLGGYTLGRSDLVRRAMSKKKQHVMEVERANFTYGNEEEKVPGCVARGISAEIAGAIYDKMMDFAKYAFNKSHAACYAVVSYQTAYLKYYYPVEYMASLMTSVIDNAGKVSEYINVCRSMGIELVPPDINTGERTFSVTDGKIGYALMAIKGVGRPIIDGLVEERNLRGPYKSLSDFVTRMMDYDFNKRAMENFIKAGAFDSLGGTRKQYMSVYVTVVDNIAGNRKNSMAGQMSLFDFVSDEEKADFIESLPAVGEYTKETKLAFEKEVLGIYISGHPLEEYRDMWLKQITANASDFALDPDTDTVKIEDGTRAVIGGIIEGKTIKYTKTNQAMAFLQVEDLYGSVEVIVFPKTYEKYGARLSEEAKVFVRGRTSIEEDKPGKLIAEEVYSFDEVPRQLWIQMKDKDEYAKREPELLDIIHDSDGNDHVWIYLTAERAKKDMGRSYTVCANSELVERVKRVFGNDNVRLI